MPSTIASCCFANAGSSSANVTQWNARSQAANHGYSHGSGIETTAAASNDRHRAFLPCRRAGGGAG